MVTTSANSAVSFQGLISGVQTDALIAALVAEKGKGVAAMQARKDLNDKRSSALTSLKTSLNGLSSSLAALQDKFNARTVTSTDSTNAYVTATATGAQSGSYDLKVKTIATKARISATLDASGYATNMAVANPLDASTSSIFTTGKPASFAIQGTDGVIKTITLDDSSNTLNGLRDKINASGAGVTATVVNMGKGAKPYQLVITANATGTGTGTTSGNVSLVDITNMTIDAGTGLPVMGATANNLGIGAGTVNSQTTPTALTGGITSTLSGSVATDATFTLNGIELTRQSNVVTDAADGMSFTLLQGGQAGSTTLTVAMDTATATTGMQDVITKYNALLTGYKAASVSTKNADGSINQAPLASDFSIRAMMAKIKSTLTGVSAGLPSSATYQSTANLGISTSSEGTLSLNTITFQTAVKKDAVAAQRLFAFTGASTSGAVTFKSAGSTTATGTVAFTIDNIAVDGTITGTLNGTSVTGSNGILAGTGTLAGLQLAVTSTGSGTLTLARGVGQAVNDLISGYAAAGTGTIASLLTSITTQNAGLALQIKRGQTVLDREKVALQAKFSAMEVTVSQMRAAAGALGSA